MAGDSSTSSMLQRTLEFTPTWALAAVATIFVFISIAVERSLSSLGHYLRENKRKPLLAALQKLKDELMLMGFISLTITALQNPVSKICVPSSVYDKWTPCDISRRPGAAAITSANTTQSRRLLAATEFTSSNCKPGYEPFVSAETSHQLHIFIVVLALVHVVYSCLTMLFALAKVYRWRKWENEAQVAAAQSTMRDLIQGVTYMRQSSFVRYHTSDSWSRSRFVVWVVCFFQQFYIPRSDYMALRTSFISTHNLKDSYDFHAYMVRTMEDEFETIVGISSWLWGVVFVLWVLNVDGARLYFWTSLIPVVVVLIIGTKLQHIITTLALENYGVRGPAELVQLKPRDQLFWFNRPKLLLSVIHLVMFETAFEFATFFWQLWQFGYNTCLLEDDKGFSVGRLIIGLAVLLFSSYSTLPLYSLVTQMGSNYKKAVMSKHVERAMLQWHKDAKHRLKASYSMRSVDTSDTSAPSSSSSILHFKSKITRFSAVGSSTSRFSSPLDVPMEEGSLDGYTNLRNPDHDVRRGFDRRTNDSGSPTSVSSPRSSISMWERPFLSGPLRRGPLTTERAEPANVLEDQHATTSVTCSERHEFLTPHPALQSRLLQRQSSTPSFEIHHG